MRFFTKFLPARFRHFDAKMFGGCFDIFERDITIDVRDIIYLIKPC
ncbi:hypothetical protein CPter291_3497 [Collimonas pratensis]|uniref:Uncharacterized protein n=1 Tax=Collimonas pratensis TaxID=279113 RepID=A0ABM5Z9K1_9BURK|nr:hypothetical protein CPter291_3497 [Collimonas pratensis]